MVKSIFKNHFLVILIISPITLTTPALGGHPTGNSSSHARANISTNSVQYSRVIAVIDGDTIEIENRRRVRYLGMDTPEIGQPFYEEAKNKNRELVLGKTVRLELCKAEPTDQHGRLLAYVYVNKTMANIELVKSGYARILIIPPCSIDKAEEFRRYQKEAMEKKIGLWNTKRQVITKNFIPASDAVRFIGERKAIYGRVVAVQEGKKAIFLMVGNTAKTGLKVVIFNQDKKNFEDDRINLLTDYEGKKVVVYGKIKIYQGAPEVVIGSPSQIEVW